MSSCPCPPPGCASGLFWARLGSGCPHRTRTQASPSCFQDFLSSYLSPYFPLNCPVCLFPSLPFTPPFHLYHLVFFTTVLYSVTYACCIGSCCPCQLIASYLLSPSLIFLISQKSLGLDIFGCLLRNIPLGLTCIESFHDDFRSQEKGQEIFLAMSEPQDTTSPSTAAAPIAASTSQEQPQTQSPPQVSAITTSSVTATAAAATAAVASPPVNGAARPTEELSCLWQGCSEKCPTPESLYVSSPVIPYSCDHRHPTQQALLPLVLSTYHMGAPQSLTFERS